MSQEIEEKLSKIPVVSNLVKLLDRFKLPGLEGLSLYDLLELYVIGIAKGALTARASAIAYSFFMALFPFLLFIIIVIPYVPISGFENDFLAFLESVLPPTTTEFFHDNIFENLKGSNTKSGLISTVFFIAIILMANGVSALFVAFESSYHEQLMRSFFKQYLYALGVALILAFLLIVTVAVLGYFQIYIVDNLMEVFDSYGYETRRETGFWAKFAQYAFFVLMTYIATATLYYFGTKEGKDSKFFSFGAILTTVLTMLTSYLFGVYIEQFSNYNKLYGSIGALLILLFYLWLNANILLLGFELNMSLIRLRKTHQNNE